MSQLTLVTTGVDQTDHRLLTGDIQHK